MSKDTPVMIACAIALTFLAASYIRSNDMKIMLTFIDQQGQTKQVKSEWPTFEQAVEWARKQLGASTVIAKAL